jgi:thiamine-phosphate pyrophosphorylase
MFELYVITDSGLSKGRTDSEVAKAAYDGGADVVQLRMKNADGRKMLEEAKIIKKYADEHLKYFIVNDRVDIALLSDADGVHLGQKDIPVTEARKLLGEDKIIGASVSNLEEARRAYEDGADYLGIGAIFPTSTKTDANQGIGLDAIFSIKKEIPLPLVAIGGINRGNIADVIKAGADCAAVVSAVVAQDDISAAAHELKDITLKTVHGRGLF